MTFKSPPPAVAEAYAVVPTDDFEVDREDVYTYNTNSSSTTTAVSTTTAYELHKPAPRTVENEYSHLPEAKDLSWEDDFFDDEDGIVAVFDLDYDLMEEYYVRMGWVGLGSLLFFPNILMVCLLGMAPCYLRPNVKWNIKSQHVAITHDGIRFVRDKRHCLYGWQCTDVGKVSKTVPFDKITDCDVSEPAGTCFCVPNTLYAVHVDTASSDQSRHELTISGLKNPHAFKRMVWAMKREYHPLAARIPTAVQLIGRNSAEVAASASSDSENVATLLREIRDELRANNEHLQSIKGDQKQPPNPTAPPSSVA